VLRLAAVDEIAREHCFARTDAKGVLPELSEALPSLVKRDAVLLERGAAERAICHRLAVYLEATVNQGRRDGERWHVDCEYNLFASNIGETEGTDSLRKSMAVDGIDDEPGGEQAHSVYPDLIVHHRDTTTNLLVIEMKVLRPSTKRGGIEFDFRKLTVFQKLGSGFEYKAAALVLILPEDGELDGDTALIAVYAALPGTPELDIGTARKGLAL
jgi:hypothetical protein